MSKLKIFSVELSTHSSMTEEDAARLVKENEEKLKKLEEDVMAFCTTENIPMTKDHITWLQDCGPRGSGRLNTRLTAIVSTDP